MLSTGATNDLRQTGGTVRNVIAGTFATTGGTADHNYVGADPVFRDSAAGDWTLRANSPCVNAGDYTVWGETRSDVKAYTDLAGAPRLDGLQIDLGCYEAQASFLMIFVR